MKSDFVSGTLVPTNFLEPLGRLFVWFCLLEQSLDRAIILFLGIDDTRGRILNRQTTSIVGKIALLEILADQQFPTDKLTKFTRAIKRMRDANDLRNNIVHGRWGYSWTTNKMSVEKHSVTKSGKPKTTELTVKYIENAASMAYDAQLSLDAAIIALNISSTTSQLESIS